MKWSKWLIQEDIRRSDCFEGELYYLLKDTLPQPLSYYDVVDAELTHDVWDTLTHRYIQWKKGVPLAYCLGSVPFLDLTLTVNADVLIPRSATEEWVAYLLDHEKSENIEILDIGTGSGCIAVALAYYRPLWNVTACDISEKALDVARLNALTHKVNIQFALADLFSLEKTLGGTWDIIISNPPYLTLEEWKELEALHTEPQGAFVDKEGNGMSCYEAIIAYAAEHISPVGSLWLEHGYSQRASIIALLERYDFHRIHCLDDAAGHARTIIARKNTTLLQ